MIAIPLPGTECVTVADGKIIYGPFRLWPGLVRRGPAGRELRLPRRVDMLISAGHRL